MIHFDDDWKPRYRALRWQWKFWRTTRDQAPGVLVPAYRAALAPILSRLGLPEPKLIFSWYQLLGFIGIVVASIFFVYWIS